MLIKMGSSPSENRKLFEHHIGMYVHQNIPSSWELIYPNQGTFEDDFPFPGGICYVCTLKYMSIDQYTQNLNHGAIRCCDNFRLSPGWRASHRRNHVAIRQYHATFLTDINSMLIENNMCYMCGLSSEYLKLTRKCHETKKWQIEYLLRIRTWLL